MREDSWRYTGSWDDPAAPSFTHEWGPAWGKDEHPASKHPEVYSIKGSDNVGGSGALSILSGEDCGWALHGASSATAGGSSTSRKHHEMYVFARPKVL